MPYPLPDEMKVDEKGKDLTAEQLHEKFMEYNEGKQDILTFDPDGEKFGAVILAAGWRPYQPEEGNLPIWVSVSLPDVVTNHQFEEMAAGGKITRPSDGKGSQIGGFHPEPRPGRRQRLCLCRCCDQPGCTQTGQVRTRRFLRRQGLCVLPAHAHPGSYGKFLQEISSRIPGIFLTKGEVTGVSKNGDGLIVEADNTLLGEKVQVKADLVVLATGMVPVTKDDPVVNLAYRQGPGFRDNALFDDYADSNFICFPMKPSGPVFMPPAASGAA